MATQQGIREHCSSCLLHASQMKYHTAYCIALERTTMTNNGSCTIKQIGFEVADAQHIQYIDSTITRCSNKSIDELCTLKPGYNWCKLSIKERIFLARGKDGGRPAWQYVLVVDDQDTIDRLKKTVATLGYAVMSNYGQVLKSGWGKEPPNEIKEWIQNYDIDTN